MSQMCNKRVKVQVLKWLKNLKSVILYVYRNTCYLRYKHTSVAEIHLLSGICPCVCCGCLYHPGRMYTAQCLYVHLATCLTAQNMGSFEFAFF